MDLLAAYAPDYATARARFRANALAGGWRHEALEIGQDGPEGEPLTIDVAVRGPEAPRRALVVSSATHGVEGHLGSAVQNALLESVLPGRALPDDTAVILIHAVNPYGYAWTRRVNEDNVDLNRNFLREGEAYTGSPEAYAALDPLFNPARAPSWPSLFLPRAILLIPRLGMPALKNAIAGGQYDFPKGVFFGGSGPSRSQALLREHLPRWIGGAQDVFHVDFHTGLGKHGTYKIFVDHAWDSSRLAWLAGRFGAEVVEPWEPKQGTSYNIRGGLGTWCQALFPQARYDVLATEFGTAHIFKVISALVHENQAHHWGDPASAATARTKEVLREVFAPASPAWRASCAAQGLRVVEQAMEALLASPEG